MTTNPSTDVEVIAFVYIDLPNLEDVKVHTATFNPYPTTEKWRDYIGVGNVISIEQVENTAETVANSVKVSMTLPRKAQEDLEVANFFTEVRSANLQNQDFALHILYLREEDKANPPEPQLLLLGRVNRVDLKADGIDCFIYTPAELLGRVVRAVTKMSDFEHRVNVDPTDYALRFMSDKGAHDIEF